jgi:16S rRNA (uracil1498-N3)-methyltransferase
MPANDRMDWLVEKATELGARSIQPLLSERSVLRLSGDRAEKKVAHWQAIAIASSEQCGGNEVPTVHPMLSLQQWLEGRLLSNDPVPVALVLSLRKSSMPLHTLGQGAKSLTFLSGPEGGLSASEEDAAIAAGFLPASLGPRVLRSETAAIAALAGLSLLP